MNFWNYPTAVFCNWTSVTTSPCLGQVSCPGCSSVCPHQICKRAKEHKRRLLEISGSVLLLPLVFPIIWFLSLFIQPASEASGLAEGQRARFAREAATRFYPPPTPSGAVGHNPKSGSGQFLGRTSLEMRFTRVGVKSKIGHTTRVDAYVCLALHAGRVKRVKCVKRAILGKIREWHFLAEAPLNSP